MMTCLFTSRLTVTQRFSYVKLRTLVDHPAAPGENLHIILQHGSQYREMFVGDMEMDDDREHQTAYFNGMFAGGDWTVHISNEHSSSRNIIKKCSLTILY